MCRGLVFPSKFLPELVKVERSGISTIVVISIHVQHLEAVDGEEAAEDALLEPRAQHDDIVLLIHGCGGAASRRAGRGGSGEQEASAGMRRR